MLCNMSIANDPGDRDSIRGRIIRKTQKMEFDASLINTQNYKVRTKGKWNNLGKGVPPLLHLGVVAIKKEALGSSSTTVNQLYWRT